MKAVLFDFDGTLADTLPVCFLAFQSVFRILDQKEVSKEEILAMFGPSETGIIHENLVHPDKAQGIEIYYENYLKHHKELVKHNEEIVRLLGLLKEAGTKLGIVTGKASRSLRISLDMLGLDGIFDAIITGDDVIEPKPNPEGLNKALSILGVSHAEAMFIGDSDADILAGQQAKVFTVGVCWLPDYKPVKLTCRPDHFAESIRDFMDFYHNSSLRNG